MPSFHLPVHGTVIPYDPRRDVSLQPPVEPGLQNVNAVVESVEPNHSAARRRSGSREWPPRSTPIHALALGDVLCLFWILHDPPDASSKVHRHARPYRFLPTPSIIQ